MKIWAVLITTAFLLLLATWRQNPLVAEIIKEHGLADQKAKVMTISYYFPDFTYFTDIVLGNQQPRQELMDGYHFGKPYIFQTYYQKAVDFFPEKDEPHFLLAYCEYYKRHLDAAAVQYAQSLSINPYFFWSYYDLGVVYFQQGQFLKSAMTLMKSLSLGQEVTLAILRQSPFYRQIWANISNTPQVLENDWNQGREDAALLMAACLVNAGGYAQAVSIMQMIGKPVYHRQLWDKVRQKAMNKQPLGQGIFYLLGQQVHVRLF